MEYFSGIYYDLETHDGSVSRGRVKVSVNGVWGYVCRSYFNSYSGVHAFCRSRGFNEGMMDYSNPSYDQDSSVTTIYQVHTIYSLCIPALSIDLLSEITVICEHTINMN